MIKRAIIGIATASLLAVFFFGRDAASYVGTSAGWVKDSVKDSVPIEFEIDRARRMVKDLVPDIQRNMHVIAKEEVEVERLQKQIAEAEAKLEKDHTELMRLKGDLTSGKDVFQYAGRSYSAKQVKADLANRFARYKTADATLASLREIESARHNSLESAREKLKRMMGAKQQLEVDVANLEARLKAVEVAQTASEVSIDESQLSRTRDLVSDLRTRLDVAEKLVNADANYPGEIQLDESSDDIVEQLTEYFEEPSTQIAQTEPAELE